MGNLLICLSEEIWFLHPFHYVFLKLLKPEIPPFNPIRARSYVPGAGGCDHLSGEIKLDPNEQRKTFFYCHCCYLGASPYCPLFWCDGGSLDNGSCLECLCRGGSAKNWDRGQYNDLVSPTVLFHYLSGLAFLAFSFFSPPISSPIPPTVTTTWRSTWKEDLRGR